MSGRGRREGDGRSRGTPVTLDPVVREALRRRLGRLAWLLDSSIRIPGTGWTIGADALLGLVPGFGDAAGALLSAYILVEAWRLGAPRRVLVRMLANIGLEALVGLVPVAGDLFDMAWKANVKNVRLLESALEAREAAASAAAALPAAERSGRGLVLAAVLGLGALVAAGIAVGVAVGAWLWRGGGG